MDGLRAAFSNGADKAGVDHEGRAGLTGRDDYGASAGLQVNELCKINCR